MEGTSPTINGDGLTSRDFTFVENAVQANIKTLLYGISTLGHEQDALLMHEVFNVACGDQTSLNEMMAMLKEISGKSIDPKYGPERAGDVRHSKANIDKILDVIGYQPTIEFNEGLTIVYKWYLEKNNESI